MPGWPEHKAAQVAICEFDPGHALLPSFQFRGWEAAFLNNVLTISHEDGFHLAIRDITPGKVVVHVVDSTICISMGGRADVEFRVDDESARNWIIRFLHYWGFDLDGIRIERGVIVPAL